MLISVLKLLFRASLSDEEKQARYILLLDTHAKRIWIVTWDRAAGRRAEPTPHWGIDMRPKIAISLCSRGRIE
jgi:hypothetical protein